MTVFEYIDTILKKKKMSRRKLALEAGIPPSTLQSAFERNGNISYNMLFDILRVLLTPEEMNEFIKLYSYEDDIELIDNPDDIDCKLFTEFESNRNQKASHYESFLADMADAYHKLNEDGHKAAIERVKELTEIKKYQKDKG